MESDKHPQGQPVVPMPSADLINYFIKETKENFDGVNAKLDTILAQNAHFVTEEKTQDMINASTKPLKARLDSWVWYFRALVTATLLALGTAVGSLITKH